MRGFNDALMFDWRGRVAEATGANVFFVRENELHTPTPDCFLDGITRRTVMDLAERRGVAVKERAIWPEELESFEQMFLTGTAVEVTPVKSAGPWNFEVGDNLTRQLAKDYDDLVNGRSRTLKPSKSKWLAISPPSPHIAERLLGRRQVVRHRFLVPAFAGSNPAAPARLPSKSPFRSNGGLANPLICATGLENGIRLRLLTLAGLI